jgi:hypothetical protein
MQQYIIVCEGRSEYVYLQRLQSFLDLQATDWCVPLCFIQKIPRNADGDESGSGFYSNVAKCYKQQRRDNKRANIEVWVDHDIYLRQDSAPEIRNRASYLSKPAGIPDFVFSFHNFEDFLILHLDDAAVHRWHAAFDSTNHVTDPLHSVGYAPHFDTVMPGYRKGDLPPDFITKESLLHLKGNLTKPLIPPPADPRFRHFAQFLIDQIEIAFPTLLAPPPAIPADTLNMLDQSAANLKNGVASAPINLSQVKPVPNDTAKPPMTTEQT